MDRNSGRNTQLDFLWGDGELGARIRDHDWGASSLGPPEGWPETLKMLIGIMLGSVRPMFLAWGPEHILLYNDAYAEILAGRHPAALGRDFLEVWHEIHADILPILEHVYAGKPVRKDDITIVIERHGYSQETHFSFSCTPVREETGAVIGLFCAYTEITRQVMAERQLASETERQRRLFELAPGFIAVLKEPNHVFEFVNQAYRNLVGNRNCIGSSVREAFPELAGQGFFEYLDQVCATGERIVAHDVSVHLKPSPGAVPEEHFLNFIYEPMIDASGRVAGIFCEGYDVTETHLAQRALAASEERFRAFVTASSDVVYRMSPDWKQMRQLDGRGFLSDTPQTDENWLERYIHPDDQAMVQAAIADAIRTRSLFELEHRVLRADGTLGWTLSRAVPIVDGSGDITEWLGAARDVTARREAEAALREREAQFRGMVDSLPQLAWMADEKGWIYWYNKRWYEYTGTTLEEVEGWGWRKVHHPDHVDRAVARIQHSWDTGEFWEDTFPLRGADGQYRWFLSRAVPVRDSEGRVTRWFGTNTDITERQKREELQKLLVHEISHRVKNSLAIVSALLKLQGRTLEEACQRALEDASSRVLAVATVHDQLRRQADASEVDLASFLSNLAAAISAAAPQHATIVEVEPAVVSADLAVPLGLLVNELVTNAYKYAYAPGEEGEVRIDGRHVLEGRYHLEVSDMGVGLPGDFDVSQSRRSLGMRIATSMAAQLNRILKVNPAESGTRFMLEFPLKKPSRWTA